MVKVKAEHPIKRKWMLYVDISSNDEGSGVGVILKGPNDMTLEYSLNFDFMMTNNQAEKKALVASLQLPKVIGAQVLNIRSNSQLVIAQLSGKYEVKELLLVKHFQLAKRLLKDFDYDLQRIPREENGQADALAKLASAKAAKNNRTIIQETLQIACTDKVMNVEERETWMTPDYWAIRRKQKGWSDDQRISSLKVTSFTKRVSPTIAPLSTSRQNQLCHKRNP